MPYCTTVAVGEEKRIGGDKFIRDLIYTLYTRDKKGGSSYKNRSRRNGKDLPAIVSESNMIQFLNYWKRCMLSP